MYKAVYAFDGSQDEDVLKFSKGCLFNLLEEVDEHWWMVANEDGCCGLVPASYLEINKVSDKIVISSIGKSMQGIHKIALNKPNGLDVSDLRNLQKLAYNTKIISQGNSLWGNPQEPQTNVQVPQKVKTDSVRKGKSPKRYSAPAPPIQSSSSLQPIITNKMFDKETKYVTQSENNLSSSIIKFNDTQVRTSGSSQNIVDPLPKVHSSQNPLNLQSFETKELSSTSVRQIDSQNIIEKSSQNSFSENLDYSLSAFSTASFSSPLNNSLLDTTSLIVVPNDLGKKLVDDVRSRCKISFNKSLVAVRYILNQLGRDIHPIEDLMKNIQMQIQDDKLSEYRGNLVTEDMNHLVDILDKLVKHKEDSQQRNWGIREDFIEIQGLLSQLIQTMDEIDPSICRKVLQDDEYRYISHLVVYYQMESRSLLRISLLHIFGYFCQFGQGFISQLLCSVLPTELAASMMQDQKDLTLFLNSSLVLTMMLSTGEPVPYHHYAQLNEAFVNFLLGMIEDPPQNDTDDQVSDSLVGLILAFNKHFRATKHNPIMQVLGKRTVFRTLSEKIMLLFNRETDPVALFPFCSSCPDSVLKFLIDIFSSKSTSNMFYSTDMCVMIDIILRQLVNRPSKDPVRTEYLSLFHGILTSSTYTDLKRRASEFKRHFDAILNDATNESDVDVYIVREVMHRFPDMFC